MSAFPSSTVLEKSGFFTQPWRMFLLDLYNKTGGPTGVIYASSVTFLPYGGILATNVQTAIQAVQDEAVSLSTGIGSLSTGLSTTTSGLASLSTSTSTGISSLSTAVQGVTSILEVQVFS